MTRSSSQSCQRASCSPLVLARFTRTTTTRGGLGSSTTSPAAAHGVFTATPQRCAWCWHGCGASISELEAAHALSTGCAKRPRRAVERWRKKGVKRISSSHQVHPGAGSHHVQLKPHVIGGSM
eukprot:9957556-Lingulodinium_polyedra.AAC.1